MENKGFWVGSYKVNVEEFGNLVLPILTSLQAESSNPEKGKILLVIDEIGKMEFFHKTFVKKIEYFFGTKYEEEIKDIVILATVSEKSNENLINEIKKSPAVHLFQV